jgi:hypothetical protein
VSAPEIVRFREQVGGVEPLVEGSPIIELVFADRR